MVIYRPLGIMEMVATDSFDHEDNLGLGMIENDCIWLTATGIGNFVFNINGIDHTWGVAAAELTRCIHYHRRLRTVDITSVPAGGKMWFIFSRRPVG
jgi:hypothetical protein